ncbi:MAG: HPr family phosphocarrier protein [Thermoprotei archaeon]
MIRVKVKILNKSGLHARPAAIFVNTCRKFKSKIRIIKNGKSGDAKNILQVLALGIDMGDEVILEIEGEDEEEASKAIIDLLKKKLPEIDK